MADLHIHRSHTLGRKRAREVALTWARDAEARYAIDCELTPGDDSDVLAFSRSGLSGCLRVAADHFQLDASLGFLLSAFSHRIEAEISDNLDTLLRANAGGNSGG